MAAPVPENEVERLEVLRAYAVLDTATEQEFDDLTALASHLCRTPIALISLIDSDRQWIKSSVGLDVNQTARAGVLRSHDSAE